MLIKKYWLYAAMALVLGAGGLVQTAAAQGGEDRGVDARSFYKKYSKVADEVSKAEQALQQLPAAGALACRDSFSMSALLGGSKRGIVLPTGAYDDITLYNACDALMRGEMNACDAGPAPVGSPQTSSSAIRCKSLYEELLLSKSLIIAAEAPTLARELCVQSTAPTGEGNPRMKGDPNTLCDLALRYANDPHERVIKLAPIILGDMDAATKVRVLHGAEEKERMKQGESTLSQCRLETKNFAVWNGAPSRQACLTTRSYRAAYLARDPEQCGNSGLCRALLDEKGSCAVYSDAVRDAYCANLYPDFKKNHVEERASALRERVKALQGRLDGLLHSPSLEAADRGRSPSLKDPIMQLKQRCDFMQRALAGIISLHAGPARTH